MRVEELASITWPSNSLLVFVLCLVVFSLLPLQLCYSDHVQHFSMWFKPSLLRTRKHLRKFCWTCCWHFNLFSVRFESDKLLLFCRFHAENMTMEIDTAPASPIVKEKKKKSKDKDMDLGQIQVSFVKILLGISPHNCKCVPRSFVLNLCPPRLTIVLLLSHQRSLPPSWTPPSGHFC